MLRSLFTVALTASVLLSVQAQADVYKYTDEKGNIYYTDKPATLPAERLDVQSQKTDVVALQARQAEEQQRMNAAAQARHQTAADRNKSGDAGATQFGWALACTESAR